MTRTISHKCIAGVEKKLKPEEKNYLRKKAIDPFRENLPIDVRIWIITVIT